MSTQKPTFTEATTGYCQHIVATVPPRYSAIPPCRFGYAVARPDGRFLMLPLRMLRNGDNAVASFIVSEGSHRVATALAEHMAGQAQALTPDVIVGLPTLELALASLVADELGHTRYAPSGHSHKFWYDDALSVPATSITSPDTGKRLRLDPNLLPFIEGKRVDILGFKPPARLEKIGDDDGDSVQNRKHYLP